MKLVKTASGKQTIKISKSEWTSIGKKAGWIKVAQINSNYLEYFINLDERGEFYADLRDRGETVYEIKGFDIFEDGFMKHKYDLQGLKEYMVELGIMQDDQEIKRGN